MKNAPTLFFAALLLAGPATAGADEGRALHDAHCLKCHDSNVYTRKNRRVTSLEGLRKQIRRCEQSLGLRWFDDQLDSVVRYLNDNYYHYK